MRVSVQSEFSNTTLCLAAQRAAAADAAAASCGRRRCWHRPRRPRVPDGKKICGLPSCQLARVSFVDLQRHWLRYGWVRGWEDGWMDGTPITAVNYTSKQRLPVETHSENALTTKLCDWWLILNLMTGAKVNQNPARRKRSFEIAEIMKIWHNDCIIVRCPLKTLKHFWSI